jgi:hypothetical protein
MKATKLSYDNALEIAYKLYSNEHISKLLAQSPERLIATVTDTLEYAPDDSGRKWKHPYLWTPAEIHDLVMEEVGEDQTFARGYEILVKLWMPPKSVTIGNVTTELTDKEVHEKMQQCRIGKVLRMGRECFTDRNRFPFGPRVTYGEWATFRGVERDKYKKGEIMLASVHDDRFVLSDSNPNTLQTSFDLEFGYLGH